MSEAVKCPVCEGGGRYCPGGDTAGKELCQGKPMGAMATRQQCHGCDGAGWVEIGGLGWSPQQPSIPSPLTVDPAQMRTSWMSNGS